MIYYLLKDPIFKKKKCVLQQESNMFLIIFCHFDLDQSLNPSTEIRQ